MKIDATKFNPNMTQAEVDSFINSMVVSYKDFAVISGLFGRAYGVQTGCDAAGFLLNECARHLVISHLAESHARAEDRLSYDITPRYHYEEVFYDTTMNPRLQRPGFESFVQQTFSASIMGLQDVSPYLILDVPLVDSGAGYTIAQLADSLVDNPNSIVLVDRDSGHQYIPQTTVFGFPRKVANNWEVALSNDLLPGDIGVKIVDAFHCQLVKVDIPAEALTAGQILVPVYPDSDQIIPYAKVSEDLAPGTRLWFHSYTLVDEAFAIEGADFTGGNLEFYKLLPQIDMKIVEDTVVLPQLEYRQEADCSDAALTPTTDDSPVFTSIEVEGYKVLDAKHSIIDLFPDTSAALIANSGRPYKYKIYYKTNPSVLGFDSDNQAIKEAVAHLAAAELPLKICNCPLDKDGFIQIAQQAYTQIRISVTNEKVENLTHGNLYGQRVFETKMNQVRVHNRAVLV